MPSSFPTRPDETVGGPRFGPRPRPVELATVVVAIAIVLLASIPVSVGGPSRPSISGSLSNPSSGRPLTTSPAGPLDGATGANCSTLSTGWARFVASYYPPNVAASLQGPCFTGHDEPGLFLVSGASDSGSRFELVVTLPGSATSPGSAYAAFWVGLWVSGVPCSYGGASYLTLELLPPHSAMAGVPDSNNWSVNAPVWSLVSPGSCDPQCQNDTAFVTVAGRSYCEDDAVLSGVGALDGTVSGPFAPGDTLQLAFVGAGGGPLAIYANDTTHPTASLSWNYSGGPSTISGRPISPLFSASGLESTAWTGGGDVGFGWLNCPLPNATGTPQGCNSYNGPVASVAGTPHVDLALSWSSAKHTYSVPYPNLVTMSSSGACSGVNGTTPCAGFNDLGGSGAYPQYSIDAANGLSWFQYGAPGPTEVSDFGGLASQFPANGSLSSLATTTAVSDTRLSVGSSAVTVTTRVSDPYGTAHVAVSAWWCSSSGTRVPSTAFAVLSSSSGNTPTDGNWSVNVPTNGYIGNFFYGITTTSAAGTTTGPLYGNVTITGVGPNCLAPVSFADPAINRSTIAPFGGGLAFSWTENASAGVIAYTVSATPVGGGTTVSLPLGNVTSVRLGGLAGNTTYSLRVVAFNPAGYGVQSGPVTSPATLYPLVVRPLNLTVSSAWVNRTTVDVAANTTGGMPSFTFFFDFGDGTNASVFSTSGEASTDHLFAQDYSGVARIIVRIMDGVGDAVTAPTAYVTVLAVPLAPSATFAGGNGFALLRWTPAIAPPGVPVTGYLVFYTTDPTWAPYLSAAWPTNISVPAIQVFLAGTALQAPLPVPNGVMVYAQVVGRDKYGPGLLPAEPALGEEPVLTAVPAAFATSGIKLASGGGVAPFTAQFSTEFTTGSNTVVVNATYQFSVGGAVVAPITGGHGQFWANASALFETPGLQTVRLYALDSLSDDLLVTSSFYVASAPGPLVSITASPSALFANSSVQLSANATGGSGQYTYAWDLGDGSNATGSAVSHTYPASGAYLVSVTVTDSLYGGVTVTSTVVSVHSVARVAIGVVPTATTGEYSLAAFATGGYGNLSYTWLFGDGTQGSGVTVTHTWTSPGTYTIQVKVTDLYGHSTLASTNLTVVYPSPAASSSSSGLTNLDLLLLIAIAVLVVALALVLVRARRRPEPPAARPGEHRYGEEAPSPQLEEESPPGSP